MTRLRKSLAAISITNRSRVTNGSQLLAGIDGRSASARRYRDLVRSYQRDFEATTQADLELIRFAAGLALKGEAMTAQLVRGEPVDSGDIVRLAGQLRRVLADLKRRQASGPAPPTLHEHLADRDHDAEEDEAEDEAEDAD